MHFLAAARKVRKPRRCALSYHSEISLNPQRIKYYFRKLFSNSSRRVSATFCGDEDNCYRLDKEKTEH